MPTMTRRQALVASAAVPAAALTAATAQAAPEMKGPSSALHNRFQLGNFEVTTLLVATAIREEIDTIFGLNVSREEFSQVSKQNFIPTDKSRFFFTPTLLNTGAELILFDTGLTAEGTTAALAEAGYTPDQIDKVVITHMHGDHIGGLTGEDDVTFANAEYLTGAVEHNHWSQSGNERFNEKVVPLNDRFTFIEDGHAVASGVTSMATFGHTPGHMAYVIESEGKQVTLIADMANHPVWSLAYPDWEVRFDLDKEAAAATRRRVLGMLAAERTPFIGYHMPFPAVGYVETREDGFRYVPHSYQLTL